MHAFVGRYVCAVCCLRLSVVMYVHVHLIVFCSERHLCVFVCGCACACICACICANLTFIFVCVCLCVPVCVCVCVYVLCGCACMYVHGCALYRMLMCVRVCVLAGFPRVLCFTNNHLLPDKSEAV